MFPDNQFHNLFKRLDVLQNFPFITSETMGDYYIDISRVSSRVAKRLKT